ncbi:DUF1543 domain-containing protein [Acinetobacter qingfengensis]|uniref:DUF1543 domain-containing protein n=1 Tax=Acinetobacter qingfengensis TaxID=1262585 RepID=A0A1E7QXL3_9GAMM|nr:DUF1543 domain-containing protein [Acinetobacter qingfengensis]KAA8731643.1 DUF1543 domain-containing protein [Acinetobacter qingfengensis]OEY91746.1 hypothetical protein BJI46_06275 [Acinetobacter qingfengensis]
MVLLGGKHPQANIEVHDLVFTRASCLQDAYPALKQSWFGSNNTVHIDAWMRISGLQYQQKNYQIVFKKEPTLVDGLKLFAVNLGAYMPDQFGEIHRYVMVAAYNQREAKQQAKAFYEKNWFKPHTDAIIDVDDCIHLKQIEQQYIHLIAGDFQPLQWCNDYIVL